MTIVTRETIYKRTSGGKVQIWYGELDGCRFRTVSGQQDGKKTVSEWTTCEGKNVGRANETTPEQQAAFELNAMYTKKLDREYRRDVTDIDVKHYTKPMKAHRWYEDAHKRPTAGTQLVLQPKLDGMRNLASAAGCKSQDGKIVPGSSHIAAALQEVFSVYPRLVLDGELYNHAMKEDFDGLMSAAKKDRADNPLQYHIYDLVGNNHYYDERGSDPQGRLVDLEDIYNEFLAKHGDLFQLIPCEIVTMDEDGTVVEEHLDRCLADKYEGSIVRWALDGGYVEKRSNFMMKVKPMQDDEFEIVDLQEGRGNWTGCAKRAVVRLHDGQTNEAGITGTMEYCRDLLVNRDKYIGKMATVKFLRYSKDGKLILPIFKAIRTDV